MGGGRISTLNLSIIIMMKMLLLMMKTHMSYYIWTMKKAKAMMRVSVMRE